MNPPLCPSPGSQISRSLLARSPSRCLIPSPTEPGPSLCGLLALTTTLSMLAHQPPRHTSPVPPWPGHSRSSVTPPAARPAPRPCTAPRPPGQPLDPASTPPAARLFCPVPSCSDHSHPSHGWTSFQTVRPHVDAHLSGQLMGGIAPAWLRGLGFRICEVCQRVLSPRFSGRCPSCLHAMTPSAGHAALMSRSWPTVPPAFGTCAQAASVSAPRFLPGHEMLCLDA